MNRISIATLLLMAGCSMQQNPKTTTSNRFTLPSIIQKENIDTVKLFTAKNVYEFFPPFVGKYKFGDTVNIPRSDQSQVPEKDYLWEVQDPLNSDSLSSDGLQIIPDYKTSIAYTLYAPFNQQFFPVYVVNETYEPKIFFGKDSHGFAIQEAIDTSDAGIWHPIEAAAFDFCGNGRFRKKINPGEFLMFLLPKYTGSDTVSLRIRFQIGESIVISKAFSGIINPKQFDIDKKSSISRELKESKGYAASYLFYGGRPKEPREY